jgi:DNA topoisomerase I
MRGTARSTRRPHRTAVPPSPPPADARAAARSAGLRYVTDDLPGIRRLRSGKGFRYVGPDGKTIRSPEELRRIKALAIPPAWTGVWICPRADGHLQATGRDERGRKQHRYHPRWRAVRDEAKYGRLIAFAQALPALRRRTDKDLALPRLPQAKVLATVVRLLEKTLIRVGNPEYAQQNGSFGLTTLRDRHVRVQGEQVHFAFRGKSGIKHTLDVNDARLAKVVQRCRDLPGYELFQYLDEDGRRRVVHSEDVNDYLREVMGEEFTAKDFRTWAGTVLAAQALQEFQAFDSQTQARRNIVRAIETVARRLGNTRAICRKCYVHPAVLDAYLDGSLVRELRRRVETELKHGLGQRSPEEAAVLAFLQERLTREAARRDR